MDSPQATSVEMTSLKLYHVAGDLFQDLQGRRYRRYSSWTGVINPETGAVQKTETFVPV